MRRILTIAACALLSMSLCAQQKASQKQGQPPKKPDAAEMAKRMDSEMAKNISGLTAAQKTKIHQLNLNMAKRMDKMMGQGGQPPQGPPPGDGKGPQGPPPNDGKGGPPQGGQPPQGGPRGPGDDKQQQEYEKSMKSILTAAQYKQYQSYRQKNRPPMPQGGKQASGKKSTTTKSKSTTSKSKSTTAKSKSTTAAKSASKKTAKSTARK